MENIIKREDYYHKKFDCKRKRAISVEDEDIQYEQQISAISNRNIQKEVLTNNDSVEISKFDQFNEDSLDFVEPLSKRFKISSDENDIENEIFSSHLYDYHDASNDNVSLESYVSRSETSDIRSYVTTTSDTTSENSNHSLNTSRLNETDAKGLINLPNDILVEICKYHPNMARSFPQKLRNSKDQQRRDKNTMACRKTRRLKKLEDLAVEQNYRQSRDQYLRILKENIRGQYYIDELLKLIQIKMIK